MALPATYADRNCSLARSLEVVGERWTLLIIRDAFYGVRRFGDFVTQLHIPRAVLTERLKLLVQEGVMDRSRGAAGAPEYTLTDKGLALWPILRGFMAWGDANYSPDGPRRAVRHDSDDGHLDEFSRCSECGRIVSVPDIRLEPGPGFDGTKAAHDPVSEAINTPRRLLEPVRSAA